MIEPLIFVAALLAAAAAAYAVYRSSKRAPSDSFGSTDSSDAVAH